MKWNNSVHFVVITGRSQNTAAMWNKVDPDK